MTNPRSDEWKYLSGTVLFNRITEDLATTRGAVDAARSGSPMQREEFARLADIMDRSILDLFATVAFGYLVREFRLARNELMTAVTITIDLETAGLSVTIDDKASTEPFRFVHPGYPSLNAYPSPNAANQEDPQ